MIPKKIYNKTIQFLLKALINTSLLLSVNLSKWLQFQFFCVRNFWDRLSFEMRLGEGSAHRLSKMLTWDVCTLIISRRANNATADELIMHYKLVCCCIISSSAVALFARLLIWLSIICFVCWIVKERRSRYGVLQHGTLCSESRSNGICVVLTRDQWHLVTTRDPKKLPL